MTWASITSGRPPPKVPNYLPQAKLKERLNVPNRVVEKFNEIERRTQVLRKLPPGTSVLSIINDMKEQTEIPIGDVVESVIQEPLDKRRFYVTFKSVEIKRQVTRTGYRIGTITIPPEASDVQGFIPDVPHYLSKDDVIEILSRYGDVKSGSFKTFEDVRCGGFTFELDLHENQRLPGELQILNDSMVIRLKDDIMMCAYCDKVGHTQRRCRQKLEQQMKRANMELQKQQGNTAQQDDGVDDEMVDQEEREREEREQQERDRIQREQEELEKQEREKQEQLERQEQERKRADARERDRQLREQQNNNSAPQAIANQPSPFITPLHATPEQTIADSSTQITPGQGTPVAMASGTNANDDNPINPVYQSTIQPTFSNSYEQMEEVLKREMKLRWMYRQDELYPGTRDVVELTEEQRQVVEEASWKITCETLKKIYKPHGMYTPFMEERERRLRAIQNT